MPYFLIFRAAMAVFYPVSVWFYIRNLFVLLLDFVEYIKPRTAFTAGYLFDHLADHLMVLGLGLAVAFCLASYTLRQHLSLAEELLMQAVTGCLAVSLAAFIALFALITVGTIFILPTTATGMFLLLHLLPMAGIAMLTRA